MHISVRWLNSLLTPGSPLLSADEIEQTLMDLGFPSESRTIAPGGDPALDVCLDVEVTSNRGDVLCHAGMAREVAAASGRSVVLPPLTELAAGGKGSEGVRVRIDPAVGELCPRFVARVIKGVKVGPSPAWLVSALDSIGQRSISNVVDVTNCIAMELGNPCHVFDLHSLAGQELIIRFANPKEKLTTLDGKERTLAGDEVVVADAQRAQSLAGVMGGADSQVTERTVDVVLEMATWEPVAVRRAARRHMLRTDASHRFERIVDARTIDAACLRAAQMIVQIAGGQCMGGPIEVGKPLAAPLEVYFRPQRCNDILGANITVTEMQALLQRLRFDVLDARPERFTVRIPFDRADITREIDLIEEIARLRGLSAIPVMEALPVAIASPQASETARREVCAVLTGLGFYETVTFSFVSRAAADEFLPAGLSRVEVSQDRRKNEPVCRPSAVPGLLACRRTNYHGGVKPPGGVRLFEVCAVFAQRPDGATHEQQMLTLLADVTYEGKRATIADEQRAFSLLRGTVEALVRTAAGSGAKVTCVANKPDRPGLREGARVLVDGVDIGYIALVTPSALTSYDLPMPVIVSELDFPKLLAPYPPKAIVTIPPAFPGIERDVSFIVDEPVTWENISSLITGVPRLEETQYISTFRGGQIGKGKKSVTVRLCFRDQERTLRHEEIDQPVADIMSTLHARLGASVRA
jgi:phenylalanyl-tRNA synthetase beta chain